VQPRRRTSIARGCLAISLISSFIRSRRILTDNTHGAYNRGIDHVRSSRRVGTGCACATVLLGMDQIGPRKDLVKDSNAMEI